MTKHATTAQLEQNVETSSRRVVRSAAAIRAIGGGNLLVEPLAPYLAGDREMRSLTKNRQKPSNGLQVENIAVRHKAIDDIILRECIPDDGIKQVIVLNSGMDTRPYRLLLPGVHWFEARFFYYPFSFPPTPFFFSSALSVRILSCRTNMIVNEWRTPAVRCARAPCVCTCARVGFARALACVRCARVRVKQLKK